MSTSTGRPTSIRIFLADGTAEGLRIVEKSNWTGRAVVAGRAQLGQSLARTELAQPGVYVLTGLSNEGTPQLYIGEADVLRDRLKHHAGNKDFWTRFVAFTSTNEGLNKAHIRYLEARLIALAKEAKQWELDNNTEPLPPPLSEADKADAEWFLAEMLLIYPILGIDAFEAAANQSMLPPASDASAEELILRERGANARGREVPDGFIVFKDSRARLKETNSIHRYMRDLRRQLRERGVLIPEGEDLVFTQDFRFASPSMAAGVLVGGAANGRQSWTNRAGITLKKLQDTRTETAT